jgi:hypothetical protein
MKTSAPIGYSLLGAGLLLFTAAHAAPKESPVPVAAAPAPASTEPKPYVLYMRTDLAVEQNKKLYPVKDVHGQMFIISVRGDPVSVPMTGEGHKLQFDHKLTLTRNSVALTGLVSGRAYTVARDPKMKRQRDAVIAEAVMGDNASLAEGKYIAALNNGYVGINSAFTSGQQGGDSAANLAASSAAAAATAFQAQGQAESLRQSNLASGAYANLAAQADMEQEMFDAVEVRFELSSPVFLEKPYVVIITRFHARDDKPGVARNAVFAKALEGFGAKPAKVEVLHGGFPLGFEIEELQVHLYNAGKEIPTDIAQKRVPLTREEAFEYLKIDYFRGHKSNTMPATPAVGRPDKPDLARLTPNQLKATYFVKVNKKGVPSGVFLDEECSQPADEVVAALAGAARYYPALAEGKAVDGVAHLVLNDLDL